MTNDLTMLRMVTPLPDSELKLYRAEANGCACQWVSDVPLHAEPIAGPLGRGVGLFDDAGRRIAYEVRCW